MVNEEYNPIFAQDQNTYPDGNIYYPMNGQVVLGKNNNIDPKSSFINVQGNDNFIGPDCTYISLVNSSGCIVDGGVNNVSLVNSSGVTVSASNYTRINNLDIDSKSVVQVIDLEISPAELMTFVSAPVQILPAPGVGKAIEVMSAMGYYLFNTTAYDNMSSIVIGNSNLASGGQMQSNALIMTYSPSILFRFGIDINFYFLEILENDPLYVSSIGVDPTVGDGTLKIYITYRIVTL